MDHRHFPEQARSSPLVEETRQNTGCTLRTDLRTGGNGFGYWMSVKSRREICIFFYNEEIENVDFRGIPFITPGR